MKSITKITRIGLPLMLAASCVFFTPAAAQGPATVPIIIADTAAPVNSAAGKPKPTPTRSGKLARVVVRPHNTSSTLAAKGHDTPTPTAPLPATAATHSRKH